MAMKSTDSTIELFRTHGGLLRTGEALELGVHPRDLYRLRDEGLIEALSRGIYRLTELPPLSDPDLVTVALRVPRAVVCLISALAFHELTEQVPHEVQIALPRDTKTPVLDYPPIRVFRFSEATLSSGVEEFTLDGVSLRVFGPAKSVADCFRFRNKLGVDVAVDALSRWLARADSKPADLLRFARVCGVKRVITPYLEALQ